MTNPVSRYVIVYNKPQNTLLHYVTRTGSFLFFFTTTLSPLRLHHIPLHFFVLAVVVYYFIFIFFSPRSYVLYTLQHTTTSSALRSITISVPIPVPFIPSTHHLITINHPIKLFYVKKIKKTVKLPFRRPRLRTRNNKIVYRPTDMYIILYAYTVSPLALRHHSIHRTNSDDPFPRIENNFPPLPRYQQIGNIMHRISFRTSNA